MRNNKQTSFFLTFALVPVAFVLGVFCSSFQSSFQRFLKQPISVPPYAFEGKCKKVVEVDTFVVESKLDGDYIVHLTSMEAPKPSEKKHRQALQFATKTLLNQEVTVQPTHGVNSGEVDAWVYIESRCFNAELTKRGYVTALR